MERSEQMRFEVVRGSRACADRIVTAHEDRVFPLFTGTFVHVAPHGGAADVDRLIGLDEPGDAVAGEFGEEGELLEGRVPGSGFPFVDCGFFGAAGDVDVWTFVPTGVEGCGDPPGCDESEFPASAGDFRRFLTVFVFLASTVGAGLSASTLFVLCEAVTGSSPELLVGSCFTARVSGCGHATGATILSAGRTLVSALGRVAALRARAMSRRSTGVLPPHTPNRS